MSKEEISRINSKQGVVCPFCDAEYTYAADMRAHFTQDHATPRKSNKAVGKDGKYYCVVGTCSSHPFKYKRDLTKHYYI